MTERTPDGLLLVDKPAGITSHTAVERVRRHLGIRRIGHAGTLDPFATGLLILLIGRATRLLPYLDAEPKVYRVTIRFGLRTTTDDLTGDPMQEAPPPDQPAVERAIGSLTGHLVQRPPAFSAKSVGGVRAYRAARRGAPLALEPVGVTVHGWTVLGRTGPDLEVEIVCSGGTYVRALARDLGDSTGSGAHVAALRRTGSGRFRVEQAQTLEQIERGECAMHPPADAVRQLRHQALDDLDAKRVVHGQSIAALASGDVVALSHHDDLLAIGVRDGETFRPKVVMRDA
ncbi:MAG: tRNA pseudouridine(55) synthase TruB [Gemmatimonadaceae bacterium]